MSGYGLGTAPRWVRLGLATWALAIASLAACGGAVDDGGTTAAEDAERYCNRAVELGCDIIENCPEFVADARAESAQQNCAREFDSALHCLSQAFSSCQDDPGELCPTELDRLSDCEQSRPDPGDCSSGSIGGSGPGASCRVECQAYAATCTGDGAGNWECSCAAGTKVGVRIIANCDNLQQIAASACQ